MEIRTDLALEAELLAGGALSGTELRRERQYETEATILEIRSRAAEKAMGRPRGTYITVELGQVLRREKESFQRAVLCVSHYIKELLNLQRHLPVLVAGLGNREVTPDAIGPLTADHILVTRHMLEHMPREFGSFRPVGAVVPGVLGMTGLESADMVRAVVAKMDAAAVIAVDAIAARETRRLCSTVQISDTGITPGSGIGNSRSGINHATVGVPVIAVGVPTVTDAATMAADLFSRAGLEADEETLYRVSEGMIVTGSDIDRRVREISRVLAYSINHALQEDISLEELGDLTF